MKHALLLVAILGLVGCATRTKILDTAAISMTHGSLGDGESLRETGSVEGEFCASTFKDSGSIGMLDESVKSAQKKFGVDFILNATFWTTADCISVEGTGAKVVAGSAAPVSRQAPKAASPAAKQAPAKAKPAKRGKRR